MSERSVTEASVLQSALELVREVSIADIRLIDDKQLTVLAGEAESLARQLAALQSQAAAEIAHRSRKELGTGGLAQRNACIKPAAFLANVLRISGAEANRRIDLGSVLRGELAITGELLQPRFPVLAAAVLAGDVNTDAAAVIVRALDEVRRVADPADIDVAEAGLVEHARLNPVQYVSDLAIVVRDRLDPDGVLPREQETKARRGIVLGRERNGIVPISGGLEPTAAALLRSLFDEANAPGAQPRFLSDEDLRAGTETTVREDGTEVVKVTDSRTRPQRQHDVLAGVLKAGIRNTGEEAGQIRSTAEVTVHVSVRDLEAGVGLGWIDGIHEPISIRTVEQILCDATVRRAILGNAGEILALGKSRYSFNSAQRKAIIARDGDTCLLCDAPVAWADAHHVQEFYTHGALGKTDADNGVLLCEPHHDLVHHSDWQLKMMNGIPHLLAPPEIDPTQTWKRVGNQRVLQFQTA